jgi:activator-of-BECN1-regulated-autophagy protein 1
LRDEGLHRAFLRLRLTRSCAHNPPARKQLFLWQYARHGSPGAPPPSVALKTRHSLRAVHFQPPGGALLLTAEVNDADAATESPPPEATTRPAAVQPGAEWDAAFAALRAVASTRFAGDQPTYLATAAAAAAASAQPLPAAQQEQQQAGGAGGLMAAAAAAAAAAVAGVGLTARARITAAFAVAAPAAAPALPLPEAADEASAMDEDEGGASGGIDALAHAPSLASVVSSALAGRLPPPPPPPPPLLPGLLIPMHWQDGGAGAPAAPAALAAPPDAAAPHVPQAPQPPAPPQLPAPTAAAAVAAAAAAAAETPCTVRLRLWGFPVAAAAAACADAAAPPPRLTPSRLTIPHAVLCSEMGAHFSPCGRFLAACVACQPLAPPGAPPAPLPPSAPPQPLVYELRVYSLAPDAFGTVLAARAVRAAHCLTSIQFSPTSEHILLAYGRRHMDLLRSFVASRGSVVPVHTVLEVYRVADMALVRQLPSADDEVNVACFHPRAGGGVAYGTKEGRVRLLRHDRGPPARAAAAAAAAANAAPPRAGALEAAMEDGEDSDA